MGTLEGSLEGYVGLSTPAAEMAVLAAAAEFGESRVVNVNTSAGDDIEHASAVVTNAAEKEWLMEDRGGTGAIKTGTAGDKQPEPSPTKTLAEGEQQQQWKVLLDGGQGKMSHIMPEQHLAIDLEGGSTQFPGRDAPGRSGRKRRWRRKRRHQRHRNNTTEGDADDMPPLAVREDSSDDESECKPTANTTFGDEDTPDLPHLKVRNDTSDEESEGEERE